uniref:Uncharacterized protein n=1 Tax=viral metagenome TaxID=1070528 RepID=A0A6C0H723_9ZZZZ
MNILFVFFIILVIISLCPELINNLYQNVFGRLIMLLLLLYIAKKNIIFAIILLVISLWIIQSFENPFPYLENFETKKEYDGIDLETVKSSMMPVSSKTIPVSKYGSSDDVEPNYMEQKITKKK